ncbi:class I SAM-dependent methyltransferase [Streptomyces sp. NPDC006627]|uniref:class I SAM-dependent methyltransferase n=1 Tax=Streptomyces sp. NPDC006627 TaxID=3154679 RepID=UPI0033B998F4
MPIVHRGNELELSAEEYENLYREQARDGTGVSRPVWDIGGPQPLVIQWYHEGMIAGPVLDAGCGHGHNSLYLAEQGLTVVGFDRSESAVKMARAVAGSRTFGTGSATFVTADALSIDLGGQGPFQTILDSCLYHCLTEAQRHVYMAQLHKQACSNARLLLICLSDQAPLGLPGPFRISQSNVHQTLDSSGWDITSISVGTYRTRWTREIREGLKRTAELELFDAAAPTSTVEGEEALFPLPVWTVTADRRDLKLPVDPGRECQP